MPSGLCSATPGPRWGNDHAQTRDCPTSKRPCRRYVPLRALHLCHLLCRLTTRLSNCSATSPPPDHAVPRWPRHRRRHVHGRDRGAALPVHGGLQPPGRQAPARRRHAARATTHRWVAAMFVVVLAARRRWAQASQPQHPLCARWPRCLKTVSERHCKHVRPYSSHPNCTACHG